MGHLLSASPYPILRVEKDGTLDYANEASFPLLEIWGIQTGEKLPSRIKFFIRKAIQKEEPLEIEVEGNERKYLLSFKPSGYGYVYIRGLDLTSQALKEKRLFVQGNQYEFPCKLGEFAELTGILPGICVFRDNEEALKIALEVQKLLWTVINNSPAVVFLWRNEKNWPAEFVSENVSLFGYTVEDFTSGKVLYGEIIHREDIGRVRAERDHFVKTGYGEFRTEYRIFTKEEKLRWVNERTFIQRNKAGEATYFQGVVIDITERKIAEKALEKAEKLRKKELNHRIKNNLQIVSSLLDLQAEKFNDSKVIEAFKESKSRILSMSLIHQELYESGKLDSLDFSSYLRKLITDLLKSYGIESGKIRVKLDTSSVFLGVDTVISLGIIINELFTNSIKYAFPAETEGEIHIALFREENHNENDRNAISGGISPAKETEPEDTLPGLSTCEYFTLVFEDNGKGFPENLDFRNPATLGFQLINTLVEQIEGSIELERGRGTKFVIKFKDKVQDSS
jgi:PAS domain S-box-containing protein